MTDDTRPAFLPETWAATLLAHTLEQGALFQAALAADLARQRAEEAAHPWRTRWRRATRPARRLSNRTAYAVAAFRDAWRCG